MRARRLKRGRSSVLISKPLLWIQIEIMSWPRLENVFSAVTGVLLHIT